MNYNSWLRTHRWCLDDLDNLVYAPHGHIMRSYSLDELEELPAEYSSLSTYSRTFKVLVPSFNTRLKGKFTIQIQLIRGLRVETDVDSIDVKPNDIILDMYIIGL